MNSDEKLVSQKLLREATDAILTGVKGMLDEMSTKMNTRFEAMEASLDTTDRKVDNLASSVAHLETRVGKVETGLKTLTTEVKAVKRQVSKLQRNTPTREEFEALKAKAYPRLPNIN